jgi:hypothetical protein
VRDTCDISVSDIRVVLMLDGGGINVHNIGNVIGGLIGNIERIGFNR